MNLMKCRLEVDLAKIAENYQILRKACNGKDVGAAVKAESYGLGAEKISRILKKEGCNNFFVAHLEEGISLRSALKNGSHIFVLHGFLSYEEAQVCAEHHLIPVLNSIWQVKIWQKLAITVGQKLPSIIHIDTGMHRLGMPETELQNLVDQPEILATIPPEYLMSHLSASEIMDEDYNQYQLALFKKCCAYFPNIKQSFANSSGIFLGPDYHFDLSRPGAALYGINPTPDKPNPMKNPVKLTAPIIHLRSLAAGSSVGYNMTFKTTCPSIIATIPLGYADGYMRSFSNCGIVYIDNIEAKVVGRVSMDLLTIDVTHVPPGKIFIGKEVEIIGDNCTVDRIASISNTVGYEILTNLGARFERIYKNEMELTLQEEYNRCSNL